MACFVIGGDQGKVFWADQLAGHASAHSLLGQNSYVGSG
jgi:hypothetical protein